MIPLIETNCTDCGKHVSLAFVQDKPRCGGCEFIREVMPETSGHCATVKVPRYRLNVIPDAARRLVQLGWRLSVVPVSSSAAVGLANIFGMESIEVQFTSLPGSQCSGMPVGNSACYGEVPSANRVESDKKERCAQCPLRNAKPLADAHQELLARCSDAVRSYDSEPVAVTVKRSEAQHIIAVTHELEAKGWCVSIDAWNRFPFAELKLSKAAKPTTV